MVFSLVSVTFRIQGVEHKTLWTREIDRNSTISPKVLIDFDTAVQKGYALSCAMRLPVQEAARIISGGAVNSLFVRYAYLEGWGWTPSDGDDNDYIVVRSFDDDLMSLNINPGNFIMVKWDHDQPRVLDGHLYPPSGGEYHNFYDVEDGAIIVSRMTSPEEASGYRLPYYPQCRKWSDVTFLEWQELAGGDIQNLRHVFHSAVVNEDTLELMQDALGEDDAEWWFNPEYSGIANGRSFFPGQAEFQALLYSPNIRGLAWLLIQHKPQLGLREINKITVFGKIDDQAAYAALYLEVGPYVM
ncbi:hypothetical protein MYCGRDRAFT_89049 [Paecilomyces variotii No. 5]|uniref:Uncharacterized protein n=1 Tax=Byssochlamys spectabilis (strain No. 5 / NBRC 109023) TaxID=1356009 RepID=V5FXI6_BYSSN|nr:hypothetical protein MYCGRDRAFT_89049 [Paecilomyces variotii No. 5]